MNKQSLSHHKSGFTLLELLIVIVVIGVITASLGYYWLVSTNKARVTEVEKTARTIKDFIDTRSLDKDIPIKETSRSFLGLKVYEIVGSDSFKKTNYFFKEAAEDVNLVFACGKFGQNCSSAFKINDKDFTNKAPAVITYAIGSQTDCNLDDAAYHTDAADSNGLPLNYYRSKTSAAGKSIKKVVLNGIANASSPNNKSNYCVIPLDGIRFKLEP